MAITSSPTIRSLAGAKVISWYFPEGSLTTAMSWPWSSTTTSPLTSDPSARITLEPAPLLTT